MGKRIDISDEELYKLNEQGMSERYISEYFTKQGRKISQQAVNIRINKYCKVLGIEKPKIKSGRRSKISDEELFELKEQGMTDKEIAEYFTKQGIQVSLVTVNIRINKYCKALGIEKPKIKRGKRIQISDEELFKLKEQGMTDKEISEYFAKQERHIHPLNVGKRLIRYYKSIGKEKPNPLHYTGIKIEEILELSQQGMSDTEIAKYFTEQGRAISVSGVNSRINKYYKKIGIQRPRVEKEEDRVKQYDDELKEILMMGMTAEEYVSEFNEEEKLEELKLRLQKLRVLAENSKKVNGQNISDNNFIEVLNAIDNPDETFKKYIPFLDSYISEGTLKKGKIDSIRDKLFMSNTDLMIYVFMKMNIKIPKGYDVRVFNMIKEEYEGKVDKYLERLQAIEDSRVRRKVDIAIDNNDEEER